VLMVAKRVATGTVAKEREGRHSFLALSCPYRFLLIYYGKASDQLLYSHPAFTVRGEKHSHVSIQPYKAAPDPVSHSGPPACTSVYFQRPSVETTPQLALWWVVIKRLQYRMGNIPVW
jgi:hypothetical protein